MEFKYDDGGRQEAGYKGYASDCVVRAIAIASGISYQTVYDKLFDLNKANTKKGRTCSPRDGGTSKKIMYSYLKELGFIWTPLMGIGTGCKYHMKKNELPSGTIIVNLSKHLSVVKDGVIYDNHDCSRNETRCVYGYWRKQIKTCTPMGHYTSSTIYSQY